MLVVYRADVRVFCADLHTWLPLVLRVSPASLVEVPAQLPATAVPEGLGALVWARGGMRSRLLLELSRCIGPEAAFSLGVPTFLGSARCPLGSVGCIRRRSLLRQQGASCEACSDGNCRKGNRVAGCQGPRFPRGRARSVMSRDLRRGSCCRPVGRMAPRCRRCRGLAQRAGVPCRIARRPVI